MRGIGWSCIRRPSLGTSIAPIFWARDLTTGVRMNEMSIADTSAAARRAIVGNSIVMMMIRSFGDQRAAKPTFLCTLRSVLYAMAWAFSAPWRYRASRAALSLSRRSVSSRIGRSASTTASPTAGLKMP